MLLFVTAVVSVLILSGCNNPQAARRKAGERLQERMVEIDRQYAEGNITAEEKDALEKDAIETHRLKWNRIGDVPTYAPVNPNYQRSPGGGYTPQPYRHY